MDLPNEVTLTTQIDSYCSGHGESSLMVPLGWGLEALREGDEVEVVIKVKSRKADRQREASERALLIQGPPTAMQHVSRQLYEFSIGQALEADKQMLEDMFPRV